MADVPIVPPQAAKPAPSPAKPRPISQGDGLESPRSVHC